MTGDRTLKLEISVLAVTFNETSTIQFYNPETEEIVLQLDPSELSIIYGAYRQMEREQLEDEAAKERGRRTS